MALNNPQNQPTNSDADPGAVNLTIFFLQYTKFMNKFVHKQISSKFVIKCYWNWIYYYFTFITTGPLA